MVFGLAAIATAATVLAPAYSRAAQQLVLSDRLASAPATATSLHVRSDPQSGDAPSVETIRDARLELGIILARRQALGEHLELPVAGADVDTVTTIDPAAGGRVQAVLAYRDFICSRLTISDGACAQEPGAVMVSDRSAREHGLRVGQTLTVRGTTPLATAGTNASRFRSVTVAGIYTPSDPQDAYWGRGGYFAAGGPDGESALPRVDAIFVGDEQDLILPGAMPSVHLDYRIRTESVRLDDLPGLRAALSGFETDVNARQLQVLTGLRGELDGVDAEASALGRTVPIVAVPLILICWFVLILLVASLTEERSPEVALAKLRGFSPRQAARFGRAEAITLVLLAVPVGVVVSLALVELAARLMLAPGVHVEPRWPVLAAAGVAAVAAIVAVRVATGRALGKPVLALLRRVPERGRRRAGIVEGAVVALAGASLAAAVRDQTEPLALLAPALLAVVAGIVTARLVGLWSRVRVRRHTRKGRITGLLAHAQISRRGIGHRLILVVTVAVALLSFSATAWDVAAQARAQAAADRVGADRVLVVGATDPVTFLSAVDSAMASVGVADPGRAVAMPVVRVSERYAGSVVELLGVRTSELADVAVWRGQDRAALTSLAGALRPARTAPLALDGAVAVTVTSSDLDGAAQLAAVVASGAEPARSISLGRLSRGTRQYGTAVPDCADCRLIGLSVAPAGTGPISGTIRITSISVDGARVDAGFGDAARWRVSQNRPASATARLTHGVALVLTFRSTEPGRILVTHSDAPDMLPVALAGPTPADDPGAGEFTFPALGELPDRFTVVSRHPMLPRAGRNALLFDVEDAISTAQEGSSLSDNTRLRYEVWATSAAPADLSRRLASAGLQIFAEDSIAAERSRLARGAPALGLQLYLIAGGAGLVLAVFAVLLTAYIGTGTRRYELAALRVAGVRPGVLRRGLLREYAHLLGVPFVVGLAAGVAGAVVMLPGIPLVTAGTSVGEVTLSPQVGALALAVPAMLASLVFALAAVLRQVRGATPDRLREGGAA